MAYKCGHCKGRHDTAEEGRQCAESKRRNKGDDTPPTPDFIKQDVDAQVGTLNEKSQEFLRDLLNQFGLILAGGLTPATIDWQAGKKILAGLIDARRLKAAHKPWSLPDGVLHDPNANSARFRGPTQRNLPDVPAGHYAVPSLSGNNDLDFFRVVRPTEGQWAGHTFVNRVIGGRQDSPIRGKAAKQALEAILELGVEDAGILYGTTLGRCRDCNRHLTDELSRALGIGPECRSRKS
jgi:uncharacterized protein DUF6011